MEKKVYILSQDDSHIVSDFFYIVKMKKLCITRVSEEELFLYTSYKNIITNFDIILLKVNVLSSNIYDEIKKLLKISEFVVIIYKEIKKFIIEENSTYIFTGNTKDFLFFVINLNDYMEEKSIFNGYLNDLAKKNYIINLFHKNKVPVHHIYTLVNLLEDFKMVNEYFNNMFQISKPLATNFQTIFKYLNYSFSTDYNESFNKLFFINNFLN